MIHLRFNLLLRLLPLGWAVLMGAGLTGCEREGITVERVPKVAAPPVDFGPVATPASTNVGSVDGPARLHWSVPQAWVVQPGSGMRYATYVLGSDAAQLELTVFRMEPGGDVLGNINRWRGQVNLPPVTADELRDMVDVRTINQVRVVVADMTGPEQEVQVGGMAQPRTIAAIVPRPDATWYFKLTGFSTQVETHRADFDRMLSTLHLDGPEGHGPHAASPGGVGAAPMPAPGANLPPGVDMSQVKIPTAIKGWTLPAGWEQDRQERPMRVATFFAGPANERVEIVVSRFSGSVGGLQANINRWREQVGLPPVDDYRQQPLEQISVEGVPVGVIDMAGPASASSPARRNIVAIVPMQQETCFIRMTGLDAPTAAEKENLLRFLYSLQLEF